MKIKFKFIIKIISIISFFILLNIVYNNVYAYEISTVKYGIENFPSSYKTKLNKLKKSHPNWNFVAVYTNLDWNYVIEQEMVEGRSLIQKSAYSDKWKRDEIDVEPGWVNASKYAISYFLDPRNFLDEEKIFQFELNSFNNNSHTIDVIEGILEGTGMYKCDYYINNKKVVKMGTKYSNLIYNAGKYYNISPVHLASRIIQETGGKIATLDSKGNVITDTKGNLKYFNGSSYTNANRSINGSYSSDKYGDLTGYYNFFNIGSYCSNGCNFCGNPFVHGLQKAKNMKWTTPNLSIRAAANFLNSNYVKYGQNTIYFEKFDVNFTQNSVYLFSGQYMTNISAASTESTRMYNGYRSKNRLNNEFTFYIPVYDGMPGKLPFTDVNEDSWYYKALEYCYENKIISGTSDTTFSPNTKITRGMLVTILYNMENSPKVSGSMKFSDVAKGKYYYNAVLWASQNNIVNGINDTTFNPSANITRQDVAVILKNYANYKKKYKVSNTSLTSFSDYKNISEYAQTAVKWAVENKVLNGSNGKLNSKGTTTRAEATAMIYNYCKKIRR